MRRVSLARGPHPHIRPRPHPHPHPRPALTPTKRCVRLLVEGRGVPADTRDEHGRPPLLAALASGAPAPLVRELLRHDGRLDAVDASGRCALFHAAARGLEDIVELALKPMPPPSTASDVRSLARREPPPRVLAADGG